jgi:hypothetical protein
MRSMHCAAASRGKEQTANARLLQANPVNYTVSNVGNMINWAITRISARCSRWTVTRCSTPVAAHPAG